MKVKTIVGCIAALGLMSSGAMAGFVDETAAATQSQFVVFGKSDPKELAVGLGNNVTLRDAVLGIVPRGYVVETTGVNPADMEKRVSWRGGSPWIDTLKGVLKDYEWLAVKVDTSTKHLTIQGNSTIDRPSMDGVSSVWVIRRGERLSEAVANWAKKAGWRGVYWEATDLESEMDQSFTGEFEDVIFKLVDTLASQGVQIGARIYGGNKVVRIMEKK